MKRLLLFLSILLIVAAVLVERSGMGWSLERPLVQFLAKKTARQLPRVTAVILPMTGNPTKTLAPQDVALTLRASWSFHPRAIVVTEPLGDFSNGPFSLIKEGVETGFVEGVPFFYEQLFSVEKNVSLIAEPLFLLGGHLLFCSDNRVLWLNAPTNLLSAKQEKIKVLALDDFLLKREEMERGEIRPDLDVFFRNQIVLIGGSETVAQGEHLQSALEQLSVRHLGMPFYGAMLLILTLGSIVIAPWSFMDLALTVMLFVVLYAMSGFFFFRFTGMLLPLFLPSALLVIIFLKKWVSAQKRGQSHKS